MIKIENLIGSKGLIEFSKELKNVPKLEEIYLYSIIFN